MFLEPVRRADSEQAPPGCTGAEREEGECGEGHARAGDASGEATGASKRNTLVFTLLGILIVYVYCMQSWDNADRMTTDEDVRMKREQVNQMI